MKINNAILMLTLSVFMTIATNSCTSGYKDKNDNLTDEAAILFDSRFQEQAIRLYQKASENGERRALPLLATCYMYGDGVDKNESEARSLYKSYSEPGPQPSSRPFEILIEISADGVIKIDAIPFEEGDQDVSKMIDFLSDIKDLSKEQNSSLVVNIELQPKTPHLRILNVMDACFQAGVEFPFFFREGLPERPRLII